MSLDFFSFILVAASFIIWIWSNRSNKLPPGPYPVPIIGNLFQLGENPHQSLAKLSKTYGPLMHLKLGTVHAIVVSSPELAKEVLHKHGQVCSGRVVSSPVQALNHDMWSLAWSQIGTSWRKLRKICKEEMFSMPRLVSTEHIRVEKMRQMRDYLVECCNNNRVVIIGETAFITTLNVLWKTALFSVDFVSFDSTQEMRQL